LAVALGRDFWLNFTDILAVLALWVSIGFAATLVLLRPMPATWAFFVFSFAVCSGGVLFWLFLPHAAQQFVSCVRDIAMAYGPVAFCSFAMRFPNERLSGFAAMFERILLYVVGPLEAIFLIASAMLYVEFAILAPAWTTAVSVSAIGLLYAVGVIVLGARYARARGNDRTRLQWITVAFSVAYLPFLAAALIELAIQVWSPIAFNLASICMTVAPVALAYTILRHRLFDIRLVVSRALVYAVMTSLVVGALALVHKRLEIFLNGVIFRGQAVALAALKRFANEVDLIADPERLIAQTYGAARSLRACQPQRARSSHAGRG
jgi:hypothetical protein